MKLSLMGLEESKNDCRGTIASGKRDCYKGIMAWICYFGRIFWIIDFVEPLPLGLFFWFAIKLWLWLWKDHCIREERLLSVHYGLNMSLRSYFLNNWFRRAFTVRLFFCLQLKIMNWMEGRRVRRCNVAFWGCEINTKM